MIKEGGKVLLSFIKTIDGKMDALFLIILSIKYTAVIAFAVYFAAQLMKTNPLLRKRILDPDMLSIIAILVSVLVLFC